MNILVIHALWLWGELLGYPRKAVTPDEAVRAGARAAALLPGLVAALGDGYDRVLVAVDGSEPWRRELDPEATERHVRWPAPAWRPFADVVATLEAGGATIVVPEPWPPGTFLPLGEGGVSLAGKRGSGRDVIATIARAWRRETPDDGTLTIVSGRSSVAGLVDDGLGVELLRDVRQRGEGWSWTRERAAEVRARLGYDPRLVAEVKALESLPGIGPVTALALVQAHQGSALHAVEMACLVAQGERLPGTKAPHMAALRDAGAEGGAGIRRALALVGVRDDVPIDVGALLRPRGESNGPGESRGGADDSDRRGGGGGRPRDPDAREEPGEVDDAGGAREGRAGAGGAVVRRGDARDSAPPSPRSPVAARAVDDRDEPRVLTCLPCSRGDDCAARCTGLVRDAAGALVLLDGRPVGCAHQGERCREGTKSATAPRTSASTALTREEPLTMSHDDPSYIESDAAGAQLARRPEAPLAAPPSAAPAPIVRHQAQPPAPPPMGPRTSDATDVLYQELAQAQLEFTEVSKGRVAKVPGRPDYYYANLADITAAVLPALKRRGLVPIQIPAGNRVFLRLVHGPSGQWIEGSLQIVPPDSRGGIQALGSALTYTRRYLLTMMLGIVALDDDDDGASAQGRDGRAV